LIVEVTSVEFEELHHQHTQVLRWIDLSSPNLRVHLQKRNREANDTVTAQATSVHLIHRTLTQERLDDEHKRTQGRKFLEESENHFASEDASDVVDANVDRKVAVVGDKFDDGHSSFCYDRNVVCDPCTLHRIRQSAEDGDLVHVCHAVGLNDQVYVTGTLELSEQP